MHVSEMQRSKSIQQQKMENTSKLYLSKCTQLFSTTGRQHSTPDNICSKVGKFTNSMLSCVNSLKPNYICKQVKSKLYVPSSFGGCEICLLFVPKALLISEWACLLGSTVLSSCMNTHVCAHTQQLSHSGCNPHADFAVKSE